MHFSDKCLPLTSVVVNGLFGVSSLGLTALVACCVKTLVDFEASSLDQETFKSDIFLKLGQCWNLESLDVAGARHIDDTAFINMAKGEFILDDGKHVMPGLVKLKTAKIGYCNLTDHGVVTLCKLARNLEHLELNRLDALTPYSLEFIFKECNKLEFLDLNGVTAVTYKMLDELK